MASRAARRVARARSRRPRRTPPTARPLSARRRLLYNQRQFDEAVPPPSVRGRRRRLADRADLIAARAYLERFRESAAADDLTNAARSPAPPRSAAIRCARAHRVHRRPRRSALLRGAYGARPMCSRSVLDNGDSAGPPTRARPCLDWWAIAVDRDAWPRPDTGAGRARISGFATRCATS